MLWEYYMVDKYRDNGRVFLHMDQYLPHFSDEPVARMTEISVYVTWTRVWGVRHGYGYECPNSSKL